MTSSFKLHTCKTYTWNILGEKAFLNINNIICLIYILYCLVCSLNYHYCDSLANTSEILNYFEYIF